MKLFLLLLCYCCFGKVVAQFNDSVNYYLKYASTGIINRTQDAQSYMLTNAANFSISKKRVTINTSGSWIYGQQDDALTNNDVNAYADIDLNKKLHKLYYWGLLTYESSYSLNINYRFQSGLGIAYTLFDKPEANLVLSDGFLFETSDLTDDLIGKDIYQTVRNSFRAKYRFVINKIIVVDGTNFFQPSMSDVKDHVIRMSNNLSIKLRQWLSLTANTTFNRINRTRRENMLVSFGVAIEKYF